MARGVCGKGTRGESTGSASLFAQAEVGHREAKQQEGESMAAHKPPLWRLYGQLIDLEAFAKVHPGEAQHIHYAERCRIASNGGCGSKGELNHTVLPDQI